MPHQDLQDLQWYTGIQHVHRIGMAESMWRDRDRERHTISGGNRFPNSGPGRYVRHFPDPRFLSPACATVTLLHGDFQRCRHRLQLIDEPGVRERNLVDFIFWRASASRTHFFEQAPHKRSYTIKIK